MEASPAVSMRDPDEGPEEIDPVDVPVPDDDDEEKLLFGDCEDFLVQIRRGKSCCTPLTYLQRTSFSPTVTALRQHRY